MIGTRGMIVTWFGVYSGPVLYLVQVRDLDVL